MRLSYFMSRSRYFDSVQWWKLRLLHSPSQVAVNGIWDMTCDSLASSVFQMFYLHKIPGNLQCMMGSRDHRHTVHSTNNMQMICCKGCTRKLLNSLAVPGHQSARASQPDDTNVRITYSALQHIEQKNSRTFTALGQACRASYLPPYFSVASCPQTILDSSHLIYIIHSVQQPEGTPAQ